MPPVVLPAPVLPVVSPVPPVVSGAVSRPTRSDAPVVPDVVPVVPVVSRYTVASATSSPVTVPLIVAGTPPSVTSRPACSCPVASVTVVASASVVAPGYQSWMKPAPRKLSLYLPAARSVTW